MPFGDRTGPLGLGPITGRGLGYCAGYPYPGFMNPIGRGWGLGMAWRRGWGRRWLGWRWYPPYPYSPWYPFQPPIQPPSAKEEKEILTDELRALKEEMKVIEERIKELETEKEKK